MIGRNVYMKKRGVGTKRAISWGMYGLVSSKASYGSLPQARRGQYLSHALPVMR